VVRWVRSTENPTSLEHASVSGNINIVFSEPPAGVVDEDYNRWYDAHLHEILSIPGFVAAQRFNITPAVVDPDAPADYRFLALFELDGDPAEIMKEMAAMGLSTKESYVEYKRNNPGDVALPTWWDGVRFGSFNCIPVGERIEASS
jgi:hypothetical protein